MSIKGIISILAVLIALFGLLYVIQHQDVGTNIDSSAPPHTSREPSFKEADLQKRWPALLKLSPAPARGPQNAPYTMVEIGDFECPNCGSVKPLIDRIMQSSNGKAKLYFVNWPLTMIHPHAMVAAEAGEAAAAQGKFWSMYDAMYAHQDELIDSEIEYRARDIAGLDTKRLTADISSHKYAPEIAKQSKFIVSLGTVSTPTVLLRAPNGQITWYMGSVGTNKTPGILKLASQPPWGNGIAYDAAKQIVENAASHSAETAR